MDTFTETSTAQDQAFKVVNLVEQGPSSVLESVSYPDVRTIQHIVGDAVSQGRENGKQSRKPRISETIILNDGSCQALLCCLPCTELKLSQFHVTTPLRNAVNVSAFLHFNVRPGELFSIPQKLIVQ